MLETSALQPLGGVAAAVDVVAAADLVEPWM
jgi:hypothetical protein